MSETGYRSLADQLRAWSDERLSRLLVARPDLATPAPHDSSQLASRAATRSSLLRTLDQLSRLELCVLDALVVAGQTTPDEVASLVHADPARARAALEHLVDVALVWESTSGPRPLTGVADLLTGGGDVGVSGLRPRSQPAPDPAAVASHLAALSPAARAMLDHVAAQGGEATTGAARHTVLPEDATTPAEELLSRRLLVARGGGTVVVPGEVGLALRGGRTTTEPVDAVPELVTSERDQALVDRTAAGAAFDAVRRTELLLDAWGTRPPSALRSGGLGVRDLRAAALLLHVDEATTALLVETAVAAGLLATGVGADGAPAWLPSDDYDAWAARPAADRWRRLVTAWLDSPRLPGMVGSRDTAGKAWNALSPDLSGVHVVETRRMTLEALASAGPGRVLASGTGPPSLHARLSWLRPRRPRTRTEQVGWVVAEAAALGLTGLGGLAGFARPLVADEPDRAAAELAPLLPEPLDHVLLQADLTAVAPGPLESALARRLQVVADVESRGGATVYRFTPGSVRRALDTGWTAVELHDFLGSVSRTPVPQPLTYLVDDTARTFGSVRVGHAEAFLRADDETALSEILGHPQAAGLELRRLAPTVLVSTLPIDLLLPRLRELGAAPVVEAPDGTVHVARPDQLRARTPRERRSPGQRDAREGARVAAVVTAVRSGDRATSTRLQAPASALTPSGSLAALREAVELGLSVLIGYVDNHGTRTERIVDPLAVEGGQLTARDHRVDDVRTFAVHRITTVKPVEPGAAGS
ncbi:helicase C-terminal domain-containing protein [Nocardioides kribbensis]|uniref:helicase C-terminal domain-containing protein n=1 Tax=Nocardioides kribbensis TaxID=305517 RepID=UPI0032DB8B4C